MKKYSHTIRKARELDNKIVKFKEEMDVLITSEKFINDFRGYVEDIARFKTVKGRKYLRSTDYAAIGIMDMNDLYQEAYLAFLEAYNNVDFSKEGGEIWSFLKKSTILRFERMIRERKDGIRINEWHMFKDGGVNMNLMTSLFQQMEKAFAHNAQEVSVTKWETDLTGSFLEVHMDEHLDFTRNGKRDLKKNERAVVKALYGIDQPRQTYKELSDYYKVSQSTIRSVKERAIKRLKSEESKQEIAYFLHEYRINTKADTENYRK